jgi:hypothetical protein
MNYWLCLIFDGLERNEKTDLSFSENSFAVDDSGMRL